MKKIGILTIQSADNFGCVLQTMALRSAVSNICPNADVSVINYVMPGSRRVSFFMKKEEYDLIKNAKGRRVARNRLWTNILTAANRARRINRFDMFRKYFFNYKEAPFSDPKMLSKLKYDTIIVGSDQVWNFYLTGNKGGVFFLNGVSDHVKKISYAASIGSSEVPDVGVEWLKTGISKFNQISVREKSSANSIKSLTSRDVICCVDPTMLHDVHFYNKMERKPKSIMWGGQCSPYVLIYGLGYAFCKDFEAEACEMASEIARKYNLQVLHYYFGDYRKRFPKNERCFYFQGPEEFLWLVHHAEYVINCSFHGTVFSVIYKKPFYTFTTGNNNARMKDLVEILGIQDRYLEHKIPQNEWNWDINWDVVAKNWNRERQRSYSFLENALAD